MPLFVAKALREKREKLIEGLKALGTKIKGDARSMNADERSEFDKMQTEFVALGTQIDASEKDAGAIDDLLGSIEDDKPERAKPGTGDRDGRDDGTKKRRPAADGARTDTDAKDRALAFQAWARHQHGFDLTQSHRAACKRSGLNPRAKAFEFRIGGPDGRVQKRAQLAGTDSAGGYTIAEDFANTFESTLVDFSNVRGVIDEFTTATGADLPYPLEDDTTNEGEIVGESDETDFADGAWDVVTFYAWKFSSKGILISSELLNDSAFNMVGVISRQMGQRLGRIQGRRFTTGTGTGQPMGIVTASSLGVTSDSATAFTADELTYLAFSIDPAYRQDPSFAYMMHDTAIAYSLLLKDGEGRPLLRDSYRDGIKLMSINGYAVRPNQFMEPLVLNLPVTAKKHVICGALSKHKIRDVGKVRLRRLDERYAENDMVGFVGFMRSDSRCVNTDAIKHLLQA